MSTEARARARLEAHGWLSTRDAGLRQAIFSAGRIRKFSAGERLYGVGDAPNGLFGVFEGSVRISVPGDDGCDFVANRGGPGFWIGDLALFSEQTRLVTVTAFDRVQALHVPVAALQTIVRDQPARYRDFYALTYENMATALRLLANLAVSGADRRLGLRLLHMDDIQTRPGDWLPLAQEDLAGMLAMSPPTLQRAMKRLVKKGLVEAGYARVRVSDRAGLAALCNG